jgi:hypothetical protein
MAIILQGSTDEAFFLKLRLNKRTKAVNKGKMAGMCLLKFF